MEYDPVKLRLARLLGGSHLLRRLFFVALDLLFLRAWYIRRELKRLRKLHSLEHPRILDAGMGFGQYSDRMLRMFPEARLTGLEIDRAHLYGGEGYFREVHPSSKIVLGDVQNIPLKESRFDLVLTVDVMEHIPDDAAAFREYCRVLSPGGLLVMHTPRIKESGQERITNIDSAANQETGWHVDEHVREGYSDSEARGRLEAAGFNIERIVRGYAVPGMLAWNLLQRIPLGLLNKSRLWLAPLALYLLLVSPLALLLMWIDLSGGDHQDGGSLMVVAQKAGESG